MALRNQPYIPLYVQDFMTDEKLNECTAESTGVYVRIMCLMHKSETYGSIVLSERDVRLETDIKSFSAKLSKHITYSFDVIERSLDELVGYNVLSIDGDMLSQKRMVKDGITSDCRALAGSVGGKKSKTPSKMKANVEQNTEYEYESEYENEYSFDKFWKEYPRKTAKQNAQKAFKKIKVTPELFESIMSALLVQRETVEWKKDGGQFIPHAATWLNGRRWEDEITGMGSEEDKLEWM